MAILGETKELKAEIDKKIKEVNDDAYNMALEYEKVGKRGE